MFTFFVHLFTFSAVERRSETSGRSDDRGLRPQRRVQPRGGHRPQRRHPPQAVLGQRERYHRLLCRETKNSGKANLKLNIFLYFKISGSQR